MGKDTGTQKPCAKIACMQIYTLLEIAIHATTNALEILHVHTCNNTFWTFAAAVKVWARLATFVTEFLLAGTCHAREKSVIVANSCLLLQK